MLESSSNFKIYAICNCDFLLLSSIEYHGVHDQTISEHQRPLEQIPKTISHSTHPTPCPNLHSTLFNPVCITHNALHAALFALHHHKLIFSGTHPRRTKLSASGRLAFLNKKTKPIAEFKNLRKPCRAR